MCKRKETCQNRPSINIFKDFFFSSVVLFFCLEKGRGDVKWTDLGVLDDDLDKLVAGAFVRALEEALRVVRQPDFDGKLEAALWSTVCQFPGQEKKTRQTKDGRRRQGMTDDKRTNDKKKMKVKKVMRKKARKGIHTEGSIASRLTSCLRGGRVFMLTDGEPEEEDDDDEGGDEGAGDVEIAGSL